MGRNLTANAVSVTGKNEGGGGRNGQKKLGGSRREKWGQKCREERENENLGVGRDK